MLNPLLLLAPAVLAAAWLLFVAIRLGVFQRVPLAVGPMSLERIPSRAARRYGGRVLFTTDRPCAWQVPALRSRFTDPCAWSATRVDESAGYVASMLQELGVRRGDRVAILKENHLDMHVLMAAVVRAGGTACPINDAFPSAGVRGYLGHLVASVLISDPPTLRRLLHDDAGFAKVRTIVIAAGCTDDAAEITAAIEARYPKRIRVHWIEEELARITAPIEPVPRTAQETLYLVHSSGTTGFPKAVILTNGAQSHAVRGWLCYVHVSRTRDRGFLAVPNNHQAVILSFNSALLLGLPLHWTAAYARTGFDATEVVNELAAGRFTGFFAFPIVYTQLKEVVAAADLRRMRFWATTADASHEAIVRRFAAVGRAFRDVGIPLRGSVFLDAQGSSEVGTPSVLRYITPLTRRFGRRIGRPGSTPFGPATRIVDAGGLPVRRGAPGRFEVRGRTLFGGYWRAPELTGFAMRDGWFFTGDIARRNGDGHYVQLDREVDVIRTRRGDVYSLLIEEVVHHHRAIYDACVYGARQLDGTQLPAIAVALRDGVDMDADVLRNELNRRLADPREHLSALEVLPWAEFPVGVTGKTLKRTFRDRTEAAFPAADRHREAEYVAA